MTNKTRSSCSAKRKCYYCKQKGHEAKFCIQQKLDIIIKLLQPKPSKVELLFCKIKDVVASFKQLAAKFQAISIFACQKVFTVFMRTISFSTSVVRNTTKTAQSSIVNWFKAPKIALESKTNQIFENKPASSFQTDRDVLYEKAMKNQLTCTAEEQRLLEDTCVKLQHSTEKCLSANSRPGGYLIDVVIPYIRTKLSKPNFMMESETDNTCKDKILLNGRLMSVSDAEATYMCCDSENRGLTSALFGRYQNWMRGIKDIAFSLISFQNKFNLDARTPNKLRASIFKAVGDGKLTVQQVREHGYDQVFNEKQWQSLQSVTYSDVNKVKQVNHSCRINWNQLIKIVLSLFLLIITIISIRQGLIWLPRAYVAGRHYANTCTAFAASIPIRFKNLIARGAARVAVACSNATNSMFLLIQGRIITWFKQVSNWVYCYLYKIINLNGYTREYIKELIKYIYDKYSLKPILKSVSIAIRDLIKEKAMNIITYVKMALRTIIAVVYRQGKQLATVIINKFKVLTLNLLANLKDKLIEKLREIMIKIISKFIGIIGH